MALLGTLTSAVSALDSFTTGLDNVGNNIANINTTAFKGSNVSFADTFSNLGTQVSGVTASFTQGALATTGNPTDLGISGNGFFIVADPTATTSQYATRDGQFTFNPSGYLVNSQGLQVQGYTGGSAGTAPATLGSIKLGTPPSGATLQSVSVSTNGDIVEAYSDGTTAVTNQVLLQNFADPTQLSNQGNNLFSNIAGAAPLTTPLGAANEPNQGGIGSIQGGSLEQSNVDLTAQFSNMITLQRAFDANARMITISDTILEDVVNMKSH
jgi:flagellar hook protein FlgE